MSWGVPDWEARGRPAAQKHEAQWRFQTRLFCHVVVVQLPCLSFRNLESSHFLMGPCSRGRCNPMPAGRCEP